MAPDIEAQQPGESAADFAVRLMGLLQEERRQKEEALQQMEQVPFLVFLDSIESLLFSTMTTERAPGRLSSKTPTDVSGKMYPRIIRSWAGFAEQHAAAFDDLRQTLGDEPHFMSSFAVQTLRNDLRRRPSIADEIDTRHFIETVTEMPVSEIITAYLNTVRPDLNRLVRFQNNAYGKLGVAGPQAKRISPTKDLRPDRWCFVYELISVDGVVEEEDDKTVNLLVGEVKSPFKLKAATLSNVLSTMRHATFFRDAIKNYTISEGEDAGPTQKRIAGHVLVAQALCQTYHYMIGSGCKYGYIATGESLVLLRVDDDFSLCYHFASFAVPGLRDAGQQQQQQENLVRRQPHETVVAYLTSLALWASQTPQRSSTWIDAATLAALRWPQSKKTADSQSRGVHRHGGPGLDDEEGSGSGGGGGESSGDGGTNTRPATQYIPMPSSHQKRNRSPEGRRHGQGQYSYQDEDEIAAMALTPSPGRVKPMLAEPPTLPYCTQACLRGLVQGQALDKKCPNVALHRDARLRAEGRQAPSSPCIYSDNTDALDLHPLTAAALRARMVAQLAVNMDKDCQCMAPHTGKARYGKFFKLTATDFGYTFAGKGVPSVSRSVLEHEAVVYNAVPDLQGFLIPVFLGILDLQRPIPLPDLTRVAHMMLMSYAGPDLADRRKLALPSNIDAESEMNRTARDLKRAGISNPDVREANVAWNAEVQRAMHFDFDRVDLSGLPTVPKLEDDQAERGEVEAKRVKREPDGSAGGRSPLMRRQDANVVDGQKPVVAGKPAARGARLYS